MTNTDLLVAQGYRVISRKHGILARVDREDWEQEVPEHMRGSFGAADFYRRVHSKDKIEVSPSLARRLPGSQHDRTGWVPK